MLSHGQLGFMILGAFSDSCLGFRKESLPQRAAGRSTLSLILMFLDPKADICSVSPTLAL